MLVNLKITVTQSPGVSKVVGGNRSLRGKYDLRERVKTGVGAPKRAPVQHNAEDAVMVASASGSLSKPSTTPQRRSKSRTQLMDKLANEIHDSLTKLLTHKEKPDSAAAPMKRKLEDEDYSVPAKREASGSGRRPHSIRGGRGSRGRVSVRYVSPHRRPRSRSSSSSPARSSFAKGHRSPPFRGRSSFRGRPSGFRNSARSFSFNSFRGTSKTGRMEGTSCRVCGNQGHPSHECFKRQSSCHICKKTGHLAAVCRFNKT